MIITTRSRVLIAVAAAVLVYVLATTPEPQLPVSEAAAPHAASAAASAAPRLAQAGPDRAGELLVRLAQRVADAKAASVLFGRHSWYVPPPPPPPPPAPVYVAPPPPSAPPLPFTAIGSYARKGDSAVYFLTRGDRVFDVRVGDTIDNTYSVDGAANGQLMLTYKPLKIPQTLAIGDAAN
jgi:hypothetical protein